MYFYYMRKIKTKQYRRILLKYLINLDINEYQDECVYEETRCGCNCVICNPYYGDAFEYFLFQDSWIATLQNRKDVVNELKNLSSI